MNYEKLAHDKEIRSKYFNKIAAHLLKQGCRSTGKVFSHIGETLEGCAYRGKNGMKCAVGILISDEHYLPGIEGMSITSGSVKALLRDSGVELDGTDGIVPMLSDLQVMHDETDVEDWPVRMLVLANEYNVALDLEVASELQSRSPTLITPRFRLME